MIKLLEKSKKVEKKKQQKYTEIHVDV